MTGIPFAAHDLRRIDQALAIYLKRRIVSVSLEKVKTNQDPSSCSGLEDEGSFAKARSRRT